MLDFLMISTRSTKRGVIEIYPKFIIKRSSDLMIRGGDFYAIWFEEHGLWSTDEQDALQLIDHELDRYAEENRQKFDSNIKVLHMWDSESGMIDSWHKYCQKQMRDSFHMLDEKLIFANTKTDKKDYASKRLSYPLEQGDISSFDKLLGTLYTKEERHKIEWAIGSIVSGDSKKLQKFMVLYGAAGTGKSTILNIIQHLFDGYYSVFDAKALGSSSNSFALEAFKSNPLVAIQHDGDLSKIEDNTRLNSLVSHELMTVNEKFKSTYSNRFKCFLFMGTNKPVKITDAKSGLIRRLIDVSPSGNKLNPKEYNAIVKKIRFELGAVAYYCQSVYIDNPSKYDDYIPVAMLGASNDFYNFVLDSFHIFKKENGTTLKAAWEMYKSYCEEAKVGFPFSQRIFKEELKNYFRDYKERFNLVDGTRVRSYYSGFKINKFEDQNNTEVIVDNVKLIDFNGVKSIFDDVCSDCYAQYASSKEIPKKKWGDVKTKLGDLDTSKLHWVQIPENHIVIDFDIPDGTGKKSLKKNLEEASKWPTTYAELSKGGEGIHLHYFYSGDSSKLSSVYDDHIEIKVCKGNGSLRRRLSKCNSEPIATISSGLPLKGENKVINFDTVRSEQGLRILIKRNLNKEIHPGTKPSIDFIHKILEDAYVTDLYYDVTDMRNAILAFAASSSHQSDYCIKLVNKMKFKSVEQSVGVKSDDAKLVFFDIEVFPNLFLVNWKIEGKGKPVIRMINPTPIEIEKLMGFRLVGFNCRRYDNHILYARLMGYTNEQIYNLSQKIINGSPNCFFGEAYNVSYTDVYDFASAGNKKGLKKFEIELGLHHQELGLPWDEAVPEKKWIEVAEYCDNDVIATEAVFNHLAGDWLARQILADLADMTVNDTTNTLTTRIIFGKNKNTQSHLKHRDLAEPCNIDDKMYSFLTKATPEMLSKTHGEAASKLPYFPGYKFDHGKSTYRGEEVGEGGYVYAEPGMYSNVALLDIASMHPSTIIAEMLFGFEFTTIFKEIVDGRLHIKHEDWNKVNSILNGKLTKYVQKVINGELTSKQLADALKTAINSVYGLTSARFDNPFKDKRNIDNIVAKRGALFMINLKHEVQAKGFTVAHIKTDSIKIPDATSELIQFIYDYGKEYGYTFEHEATYDRLCLVNDAVYIARYKDGKNAGKWTATGTQFAVPYVFKSLFSKEDIKLEDMCETKNVVQGRLFIDMNEGLPDVSKHEKELARYLKMATESEVDFHKEVINDLRCKIEQGHSYIFVGKVGQFCPVVDGAGGGILYREKDGRYYAVTGTKGYRWLESEMVTKLNKEADIDKSYYDNLVEAARNDIDYWGDFDWFVSNDTDESPPWYEPPCKDKCRGICYKCEHLHNDVFHLDCNLGFDITSVPKCSLKSIEDRDCLRCEHYDSKNDKCKIGLEVSDLPF